MEGRTARLCEKFRASKDLKETLPAGSAYKEGKSAIQYWEGVERELNRKIALLTKEIAAHQAKPHLYRNTPDGSGFLFPTTGNSTAALVNDMILCAAQLERAAKLMALTQGLDAVRAAKDEQDNDSSKVGLSELAQRIMESDELMAGALTTEERA